MYNQAEEIEERPAVVYVVCPLCGLHRKLHKNGRYALWRKKMGAIRSRALVYNPGKDTRFDIVNYETEPFLSIRATAGKGTGMKEIDFLTMREAVNSEYRHEVIELLKQTRKKAQELILFIDELIGKD